MNRLPEGLVGKVLALALCVAVLAVLELVVISPVFGLYHAQAQRLAEKTELAARLKREVADLPRLHAEAEQLQENGLDGGELLAGSSDAVAGATLETMIKDIVAKGGATLNSAELLAPAAQGQFRRVGIRVTFAGKIDVLAAVLRGIEEAKPGLLADNLDVRFYGMFNGSTERVLTISLDVYGFRAASLG